MSENKTNVSTTNKDEPKKTFPCNRPRHRKGKTPTKSELELRQMRDGD